jgi:hypothetical protein
MSMEHARKQLVTRAPSMTICMWAALVSLPQISIFRADITLHSFAHDEVHLVLESGVIHGIARRPKLGMDKS